MLEDSVAKNLNLYPDLPGNKRVVRKVEFWYRSRGKKSGRATVQTRPSTSSRSLATRLRWEVAVGHQRSGTGRRLLDATIDHYRDAGISMLHIAVLAANRPARQFYEGQGGRVSGSRDDEDGLEIVYTWDLVEVGRDGS